MQLCEISSNVVVVRAHSLTASTRTHRLRVSVLWGVGTRFPKGGTDLRCWQRIARVASSEPTTMAGGALADGALAPLALARDKPGA